MSFLSEWHQSGVASAAVQWAKARPFAPAVRDELIRQNTALPLSAAQRAHLDTVSSHSAQNGGTVFVVTGQQVGLFLGPLLTLYKALTAIQIAEQIRSDYNIRAIPLFWVQSEDHDYEEIRSTTLLDARSCPATLALPSGAHARVSLEHARLTAAVNPLREELKTLLGDLPHAVQLLQSVERTYREGESLSDAFTALLSEVLGPYGLLFFSLRKAPHLASPVMARAYAHRDEIAHALLKRGEELSQRGTPPQVHVRANSPLFFFHPEGGAGPRYRLEEVGPERFTLIGGDGQRELTGIPTLLVEHPEQFSTSALLRPLVQESLFPTAVYVGGEAEQRYFEQLSVLPSLLLSEPRMTPFALRAHLRVIEPKAARLLGELQLTPADLGLSKRELERRVAELLSRPEQMGAAGVKARLDQLFTPLAAEIGSVDETLLAPLKKTEEKVRALLSSLLERVEKARLLRDEVSRKRLEGLKHLIPLAQERVLSPLGYLAKYEEFVPKVLSTINALLRSREQAGAADEGAKQWEVFL